MLTSFDLYEDIWAVELCCCCCCSLFGCFEFDLFLVVVAVVVIVAGGAVGGFLAVTISLLVESSVNDKISSSINS